MHKDLFTTRLISLLAVQDGLVSASAIGLPSKQKPSVKKQLRDDGIAMPIKRRAYAKQK
jgi:hypothetical protein